MVPVHQQRVGWVGQSGQGPAGRQSQRRRHPPAVALLGPGVADRPVGTPLDDLRIERLTVLLGQLLRVVQPPGWPPPGREHDHTDRHRSGPRPPSDLVESGDELEALAGQGPFVAGVGALACRWPTGGGGGHVPPEAGQGPGPVSVGAASSSTAHPSDRVRTGAASTRRPGPTEAHDPIWLRTTLPRALRGSAADHLHQPWSLVGGQQAGRRTRPARRRKEGRRRARSMR